MTYAIVNNSQLTIEVFDELKTQGIKQKSIDTVRRSLDDSKAIIKWAGDRPEKLDDLTVLFEGTRDELTTHMQQNIEEWESQDPL